MRDGFRAIHDGPFRREKKAPEETLQWLLSPSVPLCCRSTSSYPALQELQRAARTKPPWRDNLALGWTRENFTSPLRKPRGAHGKLNSLLRGLTLLGGLLGGSLARLLCLLCHDPFS